MAGIDCIDPALMQALRNLERKGLVASTQDPDGTVRWRATEKGRRVRPDEVKIDDERQN